MTFLNSILLFGAAAAAIPIIIHILNRRRARVVDWGAMMFLAESVASRNRRILIEDIILMVLRCLLLAALALALARPFLRSGRILGGGGRQRQDIAIVLDGSLSMTLDAAGRSNFQRAIDEARQVVQAARPGDAVSLILAGPTAQAVVPVPLSDRQAVGTALDELTAPGGSMDTLEALQAAAFSLSEGTRAAKKIILITDAQRIGWDLESTQRWSFLGKAAEDMPTKPLVIVRTLEAPRKWRNACLSQLTLSRAVVGTDRDVTITATVANTAVGEIDPELVELSIDGEVAETRPLSAIAEGASGSATFEHRFEAPGAHTVSARVLCDDDLPGDNRAVRAVNVLADLPVLIVEGQPSTQPLGAAADYLESALTPDPDQGQLKGRDVIRARTVAAADIDSIKGFADYPVVILAAVPRLPAARATELAGFVAAGGGLLVACGDSAVRDFYNNWKAPDGKSVLGGQLVKVDAGSASTQPAESCARIEINSMDHPALRLVADPVDNDLASARIERYWQIAPAAGDEEVTVGARLDTAHPWLLERKLGRGRVLTLSVPLDKAFSDLPLKNSYAPLAQELVYHLAAPSQHPLNLLPGQQFVYSVGASRPAEAAVVDPAGRQTAPHLEKRLGRWHATYAMTARPGLYGLLLSRPASPGGKPAATKAAVPAAGGRVPFVVLSDPDESRLELLRDEDYERAGRFVRLARAETVSELTAAIEGGVPGKEISQTVVLVLLVLLVAEIAVARMVAVRRKAHEAAPVRFGAGQVDADGFRSDARDALEAVPAGAKEAAR